MYSGTTIAYNPKLIKEPPQSWADFWNPAHKGKVALADITATFGQHFLLAASRLRGGSMESTDAGFAALKELHPNVATRKLTNWCRCSNEVTSRSLLGRSIA